MNLKIIAPEGKFEKRVGRIRDEPDDRIESVIAITYSQNYPPAGDLNDEADTDTIIGLRNAAPLLLDIAGQIQPDDAKIINDLMEDWVYSENHPAVAVLERWLKMAERMHEDHR